MYGDKLEIKTNSENPSPRIKPREIVGTSFFIENFLALDQSLQIHHHKTVNAAKWCWIVVQNDAFVVVISNSMICRAYKWELSTSRSGIVIFFYRIVIQNLKCMKIKSSLSKWKWKSKKNGPKFSYLLTKNPSKTNRLKKIQP